MAMLPLIEELTQEEKGRNAHGPHYLTQHSSDTCGTYHSTLPAAFPDIVNHHAKYVVKLSGKADIDILTMKSGVSVVM